jgi:hypothetical protein
MAIGRIGTPYGFRDRAAALAFTVKERHMRKALAFLLALLVAIPMLAFSFLLISVQSWALDREFYKKVLSGNEVFEAIETAVSANAFKDMDLGGVKLDNRAFGKALFSALPREEVRKTLSAAVDDAFDVLEGKKNAGNVRLDTERLASILEKNSKAFASAYAEALPESSSAELSLADLSMRPKGMGAAAFAAKIQPVVNKGVAEAAASLRKNSGIDIPSPRAAGVPFDGNVLKTARIGFFGSFAAAAVVLLLGFLLWPKPWSGRFSYLGVTIMLGSISTILVGIMGGIVLNMENMRTAMAALGAGFPAEALTPQLRGYLAEIVGSVTRSFFITGVVGASVGAGILSLRWVAAAREI